MNYEKKFVCSICGYWVYMLTADGDGDILWMLEHPTHHYTDTSVVHQFNNLTDMYDYARTYPIMDGDSLG